MRFYTGTMKQGYLFSCKKYTDAPATTDPRLTNPYCNDPNAVNYNWGFPGKEDNSVCFYPTDLFQGVYELRDSVFFKSNGFFVSADTITLTIVRNSSTKMTVTGFCPSGGALSMSASTNFLATVDSLVGDSTTIRGQYFCIGGDTVSGTFTKDRINDSIFYISLQVAADTGVTTNHIGTAKLKHR
jgi:hypothetical protein